VNNELFEKLVRLWRQRKDPTEALTPQEIAFHLFGKGSSENVTKTLHILWEFKAYFTPPSSYGKKWRVNWTNVQRDYPDLVNTSPKTSGPLEGMIQALEDEIRAVKKDMQDHPVWAQITQDLGAAGEGSFLYEAWLELPTDSELPIPEGVGIWLQWPGAVEKSILEATLLNYDAISGKIIVEVLQPLSSPHVKSRLRVLPRVDELLKAVKGKLESLKTSPEALTWRLLTGNVVPRAHLWNGNHDPRGLDPSQLSVIQKCLGADISFIWGPPGTGKTYTLGKLIAQAALAGKRIIATSIANVAVDNLAMQVLRALEGAGAAGQNLLSSGHVIRFGHPRLAEVVKEARLFPHKAEIQELRKQLHNALENHRKIPERDTVARALSNRRIKEIRDEIRRRTREIIGQSNIILTTAIQVCIEALLTEVGFDAMVIDEASMMPIPMLACMGLVGRERLIIAGDFRQLGPIAVSQSKAAFDWLHKDAFELAGIKNNLNHPALGMLTNQRRMHVDICDIINRHFYDNKLATQVDSNKTRASALPPLPGRSAVLVKYQVPDGSQSEQTENGSRRNRTSAQLAAALAATYVKCDSTVKVGLITPYRAQVALVKRLLKDMKLPEEQSDRIAVGTVHAFQGAEADIIVCDLVDSSDQPIGKLYRGDTGNRLINVAISRAQGKLVLIGDPDTFLNGSGYQAVERFRNILSHRFSAAQGNVIRAKDLGIRV
jgi:hypothetical protein